MKNLVLLAVALCLNLASVSQVNHSYTFALGNTDGVTISWDAYGDNLEILGCYLYKRLKYNQPEELISPEMIVSGDSTFSFTDTGVFDPVYPPIYSIHCVTADSVYITNEIYAFQSIEIEITSYNTLLFEVQSWNNMQCCRQVAVFYDGIYFSPITYNGSMSLEYILGDPMSPPGDIWFAFEDNDWWLDYSWLTIYYSYIEKLLLTSVNPALSKTHHKLKVSPNPATTQAWLQLPDNMPLTAMQIELFSPTGRLLHRVQPTSQFHKIDVAHLPRGLYLVRVWDGERWLVEKLVVQ